MGPLIEQEIGFFVRFGDEGLERLRRRADGTDGRPEERPPHTLHAALSRHSLYDSDSYRR